MLMYGILIGISLNHITYCYNLVNDKTVKLEAEPPLWQCLKAPPLRKYEISIMFKKEHFTSGVYVVA